MQEELLQFKMQKVWILVDLPYGKRAIGHTQEEGIDYEEVFAPVARIEAIRLFLAYASFMGFLVYQMDVKSAFLYATIEEEVYVYQPLGFEDPENLDKVYKVVKALYRLHQAPRAWYKTLATYLLENRFQRGTIDQTLFIKKQQKDILLVQIYVDDIIFGGCIQTRKRIEAIDADEDITLVDAETQVDLGAALQGRKDDDNVAAIKEVNAAEPTVFYDEEVTMTMAQTLIKMKAEKARLLDEQMAKRLHDEEVEQAAAREKIIWRKLKKYQSLKRKPIFVAQARKNMIIYLKNIAGYKMEHFKGMTHHKVRPIFEREYNKVQTLFKLDKDVEEPTKKRVAEETLLQESFKKLKAVEVSGSHSTQDTPTNDPKGMSEEDVKNMLEIVSVSEFKVEALQVKYPLIDWEIHSEGSRSYWKIIRVGGITEAYQSFKDMLKGFDREDLDALWRLVKEKFSTTMPTVDKEKALWVKLTRLFEPNADDVFWKPQRYMHDPLTWKLYTNCGVHHASSTRRHDIFMLTERDYSLSDAVMILMLSAKLQVDENCEMARDLVMKIFIEANKPKSRSKNDSAAEELKKLF
nr:putative ribonuclease H-like domain-containing protein [Tanacetum cinerariifolium]